MYITKKERDACLDACYFISTHADGAVDYAPFEEMKKQLMNIFHKAKIEHQKKAKKLITLSTTNTDTNG